MSTESDRERNRLKQRRFRQRHAVRLASEAEQRAGMHDSAVGRRPTWTASEFIDPRDDLPRLVIAHRAADHEPWCAVALHNVAVRRWVAELAALGLRPQASCRWLPAGCFSQGLCRKLVSHRVGEICRWSGGWPTWLLNRRSPPETNP